jgi:large conductance mechanosensitive channel
MGFLKEFKEFAVKGNMMDLAIGVIIGGALGKIVTSLVEDVITPVLLNPAMKAVGVDKIENYMIGGIAVGKFLAAVLGFIVIAFVIFLLVKVMNKLRKEEAPAPPPGPSETEKLLAEIRDELKKTNKL